MTPEQRRIIRKIESHPHLKKLLKQEQTLPGSYIPPNRIRGVVLGADPSNLGGNTFKHAFGIGEHKRYFQSIENNLKRVGLSRDDVFVQNVVQNYCTLETEKNDDWYEFASLWLPELRRELAEFHGDIPIFVTARKILNAITGNQKTKGAWYSTYYQEPAFVKSSENALGRKVFPLFRNYNYNLAKEEWTPYRLLIMRHIEQAEK